MSANGYFISYINSRIFKERPQDGEMINRINQSAQKHFKGGAVHKAGSHRKATDIDGSDLDLCLLTNDPVTEAMRRAWREELKKVLNRPAVVQSHVIRLPANGADLKIDIAFANAAFGSRPLPNPSLFRVPARQHAARAMKLWTRRPGMPHISGWAIEALVIHLDQPAGTHNGLILFCRILEWLEAKATQKAVEGVLRAAAVPGWRPEWSKKLPGTLEALQNQARKMTKQQPQPEAWESAEDVNKWLCG